MQSWWIFKWIFKFVITCKVGALENVTPANTSSFKNLYYLFLVLLLLTVMISINFICITVITTKLTLNNIEL